MKKLSIFILLALACGCFISCNSKRGRFTEEEISLINTSLTEKIPGVPFGTARILTVKDSLDLAILRTPSEELSSKTIESEEFTKLCRLMFNTVKSPANDGVGLAAPQIGINRRVIAVKRFDKEREPFEIYPNIHIEWASDSLAYGTEACLSVPQRWEEIARSQEIIVSFSSSSNPKKTVRDTIRGYTAVIFQHEIDHLDGILYFDRL